MDYRQLCLDLFGTDDVGELTALAQAVCGKNPRQAGRKKKFTPADVEQMQRMREHGITMEQVAQHFKTSRQVVGRYLRTVPPKGYTLRMTYMYKNHPCTLIDVDVLRERIRIENRTTDVLHRAFGVIEHPSWEEFEVFLGERCFPATRGNAKDLLEQLGLSSYDPMQIVEKTKGKMADDQMWIQVKYYPEQGVWTCDG